MEVNMENITKKYLENSICDYIRKDMSFDSIVGELNLRCDNMIKSIEKRESDLNVFSNLFLGLENPNSDRVEKRIKYMYFYITNTQDQINNIKWIITNKTKFKEFNNLKLYKLSLLKNKLSEKKNYETRKNQRTHR